VLLLIRQMEATATTATAARVSLLCIGQQAIMDAYLCLLHLTTGVCHLHRAGSNHSGPPSVQPGLAWPGHVAATCSSRPDFPRLCLYVSVILVLNVLNSNAGIMVEPLFNAFATAAFFEFVIFAIFEMRWLLIAWRARRGTQVRSN